MMWESIAIAVAAAAAGAGSAAKRRRDRRARLLREQREINEAMIASVRRERERGIDEARQRAALHARSIEQDLELGEESIGADLRRLDAVERASNDRSARIEERCAALDEQQATLRTREGELRAAEGDTRQAERATDAQVQSAAGRTREEILHDLHERLVSEARVNADRAARALEEHAQNHRERLARHLIDVASQRYGTPLPAARLIATAALPENAELRHRVESDGRAVLQAITEATGVRFVDRAEGELHLQAADPYTREIGRLAYERLIRGGKVDEETAQRLSGEAARDLEKICRDAGNRAARILKLKDIHPEILLLVGKLLYRTSYTQNQWQHAIETAHLCGMMADDLGLDRQKARRSALIHDIGKVLWAETEAVGSHAVSGAAFATEHGETPEIVHPIAAHHNDERPSSALAHLVAAADALSGARPGARRETDEAYGRRVEEIEGICQAFSDIKDAFIIQGGREVRVMVDPRKVDDLGALRLSEDIAARIEDEMEFPGQIKVTVLREIRATAVAR